MERMKFNVILLPGAAAAVLGLGLLLWRHIDRTRIVASATTLSGVELRVSQSFNRNLGEIFTTSFYYRKPGSTNWNWRYYCHEDWYWGRGRVELDEPAKTATIYRGGRPTIRFNWATETYIQFTETQSGRPITNGPAPFAAITNRVP
jgi:hypothetical protein